MDKDLPNVVLTLLIAGAILFVGIGAVSSTVQTTADNSGTTQTAALLDGTNFVSIADTTGTNEQVYDSRGYAVGLTGANDSYIRSTEDITITNNDTWTLSVWAARDSGASGQQIVVSIDGEIEIAYNASRGEWTGWYYDDGDRASYRVNASATSAPGEFANVVLVNDGSDITIYANATAGEQENLDGTTQEPYVSGDNWDGRIEELRVHDTAWNSTIRQDHYQSPIDPVTDGARARVMFDEPYRDTQRIIYHPGEMQLSNASLLDGLPGQKLVTGSVLGQNDYEWQSDGPRIRAVDGGELENAPIAYIDYKQLTQVNSLLSSYSSALTLAGVLLTIVPLGMIILYMQNARGGR